MHRLSILVIAYARREHDVGGNILHGMMPIDADNAKIQYQRQSPGHVPFHWKCTYRPVLSLSYQAL